MSPVRGHGRPGPVTRWIRAHPRTVLLAPVVAFLWAFFVAPLAAVFRVSLASNPGGTGYGDGTPFYLPGTWTLANYIRFFGDPYFLQIMSFTVELGLSTAAATILVSYALAWQIHRARPLMKGVLLLAVVLPKFTNILVLMYGFLIVFGANGLINQALIAAGITSAPVPMVYNLFAVLLGEVVLIMPYCVLILVAVLHTIDPELEDSARSLGASEGQVFWYVTLPLSLPGVWVATLLSFIWGVGAFVAPYLLGTPEHYTLAVEVDRQTNWRLNWAMGSAVAMILVAVIGVVVTAYLHAQRRIEAPA